MRLADPSNAQELRPAWLRTDLAPALQRLCPREADDASRAGAEVPPSAFRQCFTARAAAFLEDLWRQAFAGQPLPASLRQRQPGRELGEVYAPLPGLVVRQATRRWA